jgi:hypothetical protein
MFEKFSGFFKRFSRRQKKQSGETTIMDAKEPGLDEMGLDESFGDLSDLEQSIDKIGTAPAERGTGGPSEGVSFPDADLDTGDFSTGGSDFDEQTISDEISGEKISTGYEEAAPEAEAGAFGEEIGEISLGEEPVAAPEPLSPKKRILVTLAAAVAALALGGVFQMFGWPYVGKMAGLADSEKPKVDVEALLGAAKRENTKLNGEIGQFKGIGSPTEVKKLQQEIAQARDVQGAVEGLESKFNEAKERETAYDELVKQVSELQVEIGSAQGDINAVKSKIEGAKQRVVVLRKQTELEYARFQNEMARAEISRRVLIELEKEDNRRFQEELRNLQERLSQLPLEQAQAVPSEGASATDSTAAGI